MWFVFLACMPLTNSDGTSALSDTGGADRSGDEAIPGNDGSGGDDSGSDDTGDDTALPAPDDTASTDPNACDWMSWSTVGQPFFKTWCTACHSADLPEEKRQDAPLDCNLDTYEDVVAWGPIIADKLDERSMPPKGTPPDDLTDAVLHWLDCGAPQ